MRKIKHSNAASGFHSMKIRHVQMVCINYYALPSIAANTKHLYLILQKATDNQNLNTPDKSTEL